MKACGYCGRHNDDLAARCRECGTPFPVGRPNPSKPSWEFPATPPVPGVVAGGLAVVSIFTGIVVATRHAFPAVYLLALLFLPWLLLLVVVLLCLTLYAATVCCRTQWHRVVFTCGVMAVLCMEWEVWFSGEAGLGGHGSPASVYGASALLILAGALTLAWIARRNRPPQRPLVPPVAPSNANPALPAGTAASAKPPPPAS
jgi:hypothetical protein